MKKEVSQILANWGEYLINKLLHPIVIFATPTFIMLLLIYFIINDFSNDLNTGFRSFAGAVLPLIIMTYIFIFQKDLLKVLNKINVLVGFIGAFLVGNLLMAMINFFGPKSSIPLNEFVLSGSFSILVFSYVSMRENRMLSFYYGAISGFLFYITMFGLPFTR